jgi:hypothetical protein
MRYEHKWRILVQEMHTNFWFESLKGRDRLGVDIGGRVILEWILKSVFRKCEVD